MYNKIVVGIDQSYENTGISIACDGKLVKVTSLNLACCDDPTAKRKMLKGSINRIIQMNKHKAKDFIIICEKIRTFSGGFLSTNYIKATGALIATIVDEAYEHGISVYSVDTRHWKSVIVGTSKPDENGNNKMPTIKYVCKLGFKSSLLVKRKRAKKGSFVIDGMHYSWNDDAADSACIALYGFSKDWDECVNREG